MNLISFNPELQNGHELNVLQYKNMISPFCKENILTLKSNSTLVVDNNYGLVYDEVLINSKCAIYGDADKIPMYSGDQLENLGYLRVPFRKIPRIKLNNQQELNELLSMFEVKDKNLKLQFRGQNSEHYIERTDDEKLALFNSKDSLEPSLIPSAVRRNILMEDIMPIWNNMLQKYLDYKLSIFNGSNKIQLTRDLLNFKTNVNFAVFSLSLAQHYGFPSVGLDSTPNINTAIFFATHKFQNVQGKCSYKHNIHDLENPPVIYVLAPAERNQFDYRYFKPVFTEFLRPDYQEAHFLHTGWGLNKNRSARSIWLALYLDQNGDFGKDMNSETLFPPDDEFVNFIDPIIKKINNENLNPYFKDFYKLN